MRPNLEARKSETAAKEVDQCPSRVLALALVQRWGRILPRTLLLIAGYGAALRLISVAALLAFGMIAQVLGVVNGPIRFRWSEWPIYDTYLDWLLLGIALGMATWAINGEPNAADEAFPVGSTVPSRGLRRL